MGDLEAERVRKFLRSVYYTACSRDIVGAGFAGKFLTKSQAVGIEFKPNTRDGERSPTWSETSEKGYAAPALSFGAASAGLSEQSSRFFIIGVTHAN